MKEFVVWTLLLLFTIPSTSQNCEDAVYGFRVIERINNNHRVNYVKLDNQTGDIEQLSPIEYSVRVANSGVINDEFYFMTSQGFNMDELVFLDLKTGVEKRRFDIFRSAWEFTTAGCGTSIYGFMFTPENGGGAIFVSINIYSGEITELIIIPDPYTTGNLSGIINDEYYYIGTNQLTFLDLKTGEERRRFSLNFGPGGSNFESPGLGDKLYYMDLVSPTSTSLFSIDINTGMRTQITDFNSPRIERFNTGIINNEFYFQYPEEFRSDTDTSLVFLDLETGLETRRIDLQGNLYKAFATNCNAVCICTNETLAYPNPFIISDSTYEYVSQTITMNGGNTPVELQSGNKALLSAGQSIEINPSFEVKLGAELLLEINACL